MIVSHNHFPHICCLSVPVLLLTIAFVNMAVCFLLGSLSVSKWIHLNWGDDGIIKLFFKVWKLLEPVSVKEHSIYFNLSILHTCS